VALNVMGFSISRILNILITLSVVAVFIAVCADFYAYDKKVAVRKSRRSIVATGSMTGFYVVYYMVLRFQLGGARVWQPGANIIAGAGMMTSRRAAAVMGLAGAMMIIAGAIINILGRTRLKGNWANHIKIYEDHGLVDSGVYKLVRHPLYASTILMFFGGSLAYRNWLSAILTALVFIPFMYYRARQEEALLIEEVPGYREYMKKTGMFFPKLWKEGDADGGV